MCTSWFKQTTPNWAYHSRVALLFAINIYGTGSNSGNNLRGCINDVNLAEQKLLPENFQIRKFLDSKVTRKRILMELEYALANSKSGDIIYVHYSGHGTLVRDYNGDELSGYDQAWYVYDGVLVDDQLHAVLAKVPVGVTVILLIDSCHSGSSTRSNYYQAKYRFIDPGFKVDITLPVSNRVLTDNAWISMAGCRDDQTAADAYIASIDKYHGIFSYYALNTLRRTYTYVEWYDTIRLYLPNTYFDQEPVLEGRESSINQIVLF